MAISSSFRNRDKATPDGKGVQRCSRAHGSLISSSWFLLMAIAFVCALLHPSQAARNIFVDDVDRSIKYVGDEWERIEAKPPSAPTFGGSWMSAWPKSTFIGRNSSYELSFEFSGTALYLYYPLWPFSVSSGNISVDGSQPVILSLRDMSQAQVPIGEVSEGDPPSSLSRIRYSLEGLQPGPHKLVISPDDSVHFVAFDALMYTDDRLDPDVINDWHTDLSPEPATTMSSGPPPSPTTSDVSLAQKSNKVVVIAASASAGVAALLAIVFFIFCRKRQKRTKGPPHDLTGVGMESKAHIYDSDAQGTFTQTSYRDGSYVSLGAHSPFPSPSPSPLAATHHIQPSAEALLPLQSETDSARREYPSSITQGKRHDQGILYVRNGMSTADTIDDISAPPAY